MIDMQLPVLFHRQTVIISIRTSMLTGKRFKLAKATLAIDVIDGKRTAITIPAEATIKVVSEPSGHGDQMIHALWEGRTVVMFAVDIQERGTGITGQSAKAYPPI